MKNKVLIIYKCIPHYRAPFFEKLRQKLSERGIQLDLIYGDGDLDFRGRGGMVVVPWGISVKNYIFRIFGVELLWQPILKYIRRYDLIISMQENKLVVNYVLFILQLLGGPKIALWGHGRTMGASKTSGIKAFVKRAYSRWPFWWFAYTKKCRDIVCSLGFPEARITVVENAIDNVPQREFSKSLTEAEKCRLLHRYGLTGENTCIYCGALYKEKNLPFLFETCNLLAEKVHNFELIVIGSGEEKPFVEEKARRHKWVKYFGEKFGEEKAGLFYCSKLLLIPGGVGLAISDSFIFGKPIITTDNPHHGPEIDYLDNGNNGVITPHSVPEYSAAIKRLLEDGPFYAKIQKGALDSGQRYSMECMVDNFITGAEKALALINRGGK